MTGTVIDSLVVELGLDPAKFTKGQRDALDAFKKTQGEFDKRLKDLEASGKRAGDSFGGITTAAEGLFGVLAGAGMAAFARDTMNSAAATGRMAQNMGLATDELSTFGRMIERNGGNANSAMGSLKGYTDQLARLRTFGEGAQNWAQIGITGVEPGMNALQAYMKFAEYAGRNRNDPSRVNILGQSLGLDQAAINEALKGVNQVRKDWEDAKVGALTPEQAAAMQRMQEAWVSLDQAISMVGRDLVVDVEPAFSAIAKAVSGWIEGNRGLADSLGGILTAITAFTALKPAMWILRLLGLEGVAAVATGPVGVAAAGAYALAPSALNSGEKNIYQNGKLTDYGQRLIATIRQRPVQRSRRRVRARSARKPKRKPISGRSRRRSGSILMTRCGWQRAKDLTPSRATMGHPSARISCT